MKINPKFIATKTSSVFPASGGGPHGSRILAEYYGLNANISFTFEQNFKKADECHICG